MIRKTFLFWLLLASTFSFSQDFASHIVPASATSVDSADYFLQKGLREKKNGRRMESLKNFEKALKYDANNKAVIAELASAYLDLRRYSFARDNFKKLVELGDNSAGTCKQLLTLSFQLKQYEDVLTYAARLKKLDPSEKINFYVGKVQYEQDNYGEAIKTLGEAAKEEPANAEIPYMIAHSYADMMNYKQAIPYFQKAIELNPTQNYWIYELGLICYAMHDDKNALKYILEAGAKGYKRDNDYLENLGIAYLNVGDLDQGVAILGEILKRKPSDLNILNMVAEAYYYKGKYQQAIDYWDQVMYYDKNNASALYMIGMCYQKKGDKAKGQHLCDKAIELDPALASLKQKKQMMGF
ncbi:MAG TPA: tetratricopeptide repeat protein [Chitinophagaceae bacterium]|nr:tetratricopeptide repeat protein [Chitinophagaceae bacterium]